MRKSQQLQSKRKSLILQRRAARHQRRKRIWLAKIVTPLKREGLNTRNERRLRMLRISPE